MLRQAMALLDSRHSADVLRPVMDLIYESSNQAPSNVIDFLLDVGHMVQLVSCMSHTNTTVRNHCLLAVGCLDLGNESHTWAVVKTGMLSHLVSLLHYDDVNTVKNTLWILSNIADGEAVMAYVFFDYQIFDSVLYYMRSEHQELVKEALWTVSNLVRECDRYVKRTYRVQCRNFIETMIMSLDIESEIVPKDNIQYYG